MRQRPPEASAHLKAAERADPKRAWREGPGCPTSTTLILWGERDSLEAKSGRRGGQGRMAWLTSLRGEEARRELAALRWFVDEQARLEAVLEGKTGVDPERWAGFWAAHPPFDLRGPELEIAKQGRWRRYSNPLPTNAPVPCHRESMLPVAIEVLEKNLAASP